MGKQFGFTNIVCSTGEIALDYDDYLYTKHWALLRERIFAQRKETCERCHKQIAVYQIHHKCYDNLGNEKDEDVMLLCVKCHETLHRRKDKERKNKRLKRKARLRELKSVRLDIK